MAPPPPPPPQCFPFGTRRRRTLSDSRSFLSEKTRSDLDRDRDGDRDRDRDFDRDSHSYTASQRTTSLRSRSIPRTTGNSLYTDRAPLSRSNSYSPTATITSRAEKLTFDNDSESYNNLPSVHTSTFSPTPKKRRGLGFGFGWLLGRNREKELERERSGGAKLSRNRSLRTPSPTAVTPFIDGDTLLKGKGKALPPLTPTNPDATPQSSPAPSRQHSQRSNGSGRTDRTDRTAASASAVLSPVTPVSPGPAGGGSPLSRNASARTGGSGGSRGSAGTPPIRPARPQYQRNPNDSSSTLIGSAIDRKIAEGEASSVTVRVETSERLRDVRALMEKDNLDFLIVPSEDAHGSEYVAPSDKRRQFISGFTGSAGQAIISRSQAYLVTDSRYWLQAEEELDDNWELIRASTQVPGGWADWQTFLLNFVGEGMRIGIDARMINYARASALNAEIQKRGGKLTFPSQNLVDLVWKTKPARSKAPVFVHDERRFAGQRAGEKLESVREWIKEQPPVRPSFKRGTEVEEREVNVAMLVSSLPSIAWVLNLRGHDIPYCPVFHAYLFISLDTAVLFVELAKLPPAVQAHLDALGVEAKEYNDVWSFLRRAPWGAGRVLISADETSYAIALLLTHFRYTLAPLSFVEHAKAVKNFTEIEGLRRAYLRDGVAYVRWLAWLEDKMMKGYEITEWEATQRLGEYRRRGELYEGPAYEPISATGKNAALPHYSPNKKSAAFIERDTPYLNDSGGQYLDGTIDTTRTVHFGRPPLEQCEAYTRVLQGHIAIDSAVFPIGTSGQQLDVLARNALWKEGLTYLHGTGHGFGTYLNVHEGPHGFSSPVPLKPGHVITNEPGFYKDGHWGVRIESALLVRKVKTKHGFGGDHWLGFERLTVVPIQTKMVREGMLSKDEVAWIKEHNRACREKLEPLLREDKRALKWLRREAERGIGLAPATGGFAIDWD